MFNKQKTRSGLTGLSLVNNELCIAHVDRVAGTAELQMCESVKTESPEAAARELTARVAQWGLAGARCNFVLAPDDYTLLLIEAPSVEKNELAAAAKWKIKDMIDRPLDQLVITVFPVPNDAYRNLREMIYVVAADKKKILQIIDLVAASGLTLNSIDIPELALKNTLRVCQDDNAGVAVMDLRQRGSLLNLCKNESIYLTRNLNTQVSDEILGSDEWENIRERLALEIQRSLDYYESQMGQSQISKILLAPRKHDSEALQAQLNDVMGVKVEVMDLMGKLASNVELPLSLQHDCLLAISAALRTEQVAA